MSKQFITEAARMQELAGISKTNPKPMKWNKGWEVKGIKIMPMKWNKSWTDLEGITDVLDDIISHEYRQYNPYRDPMRLTPPEFYEEYYKGDDRYGKEWFDNEVINTLESRIKKKVNHQIVFNYIEKYIENMVKEWKEYESRERLRVRDDEDE